MDKSFLLISHVFHMMFRLYNSRILFASGVFIYNHSYINKIFL
nr:MAG TPA: hypothetical protein [Caudoviricetes sp.]